MTELYRMSLLDASTGIANGSLSARELYESCRSRIEEFNDRLGAFSFVADSRSVDQDLARASLLRERGSGSPLSGIPVGVKEVVDVSGMTCTAGSRLFAGRVAAADSAVAALLREQGCVFPGMTSAHELGCGPITPQTFNPWDRSRIAGGSSGGSAVAVATGMCPVAIGTDTSGSSRIPAALCGVVGFKPAFGEWPIDGVVPISRALDHLGILARNVADIAMVRRTLTEKWPGRVLDRAVGEGDRSEGTGTALSEPSARPARCIGVVQTDGDDNIAPQVARAVDRSADYLQDHGYIVEPISLSQRGSLRAAQLSIVRFDLFRNYRRVLPDVEQQCGRDVATLIASGSRVSETEYRAAIALQREVRGIWSERLADIDCLLLPTVGIEAPLIGQQLVEGNGGRSESVREILTRLTFPFNFVGWPALSIPISGVGSSVPIGVQLAAKPGTESRLFEVAKELENFGGMRDRLAPLTPGAQPCLQGIDVGQSAW